MPKEILKIDNFDLGLNQNSDSASIADNELYEATGVELSKKGAIVSPGVMNITPEDALGGKVDIQGASGIDALGSVIYWMTDFSREMGF